MIDLFRRIQRDAIFALHKSSDRLFEFGNSIVGVATIRRLRYEAFEANGIGIIPFAQHHGGSDSLGVRIGDFVYSSDAKSLPAQSRPCLANIDTWILDCDYWERSDSHGDPETVLEYVDQFKPIRVLLTHMDEKMDYSVLKSWFADRGYAHVTPAYDGLEFDLTGTS